MPLLQLLPGLDVLAAVDHLPLLLPFVLPLTRCAVGAMVGVVGWDVAVGAVVPLLQLLPSLDVLAAVALLPLLPLLAVVADVGPVVQGSRNSIFTQ